MEMDKDEEGKMNHDMEEEAEMDYGKGEMNMKESMFSEFNYDYLESPEKTQLSEEKPVKEVLLNLTGNR